MTTFLAPTIAHHVLDSPRRHKRPHHIEIKEAGNELQPSSSPVQSRHLNASPKVVKKSPGHHTKASDGNASFLRAARAGNLEKVLEYLKGSTDINTSNANGLNALHLASKEGHVNIVTELLHRRANVNAATKKGNTALHIASLAGQEEIVKILLHMDAKVNVQSQNGFTPLYMAAQENHASVVKLLLSNGASQSLATEDGFTPLAVALQQGHDKVVAVLLENDSRGKVRLPALHIAAKKDDTKAAALLLQSEQHNVNQTSKSGFTPLHIAAHYGNTNVGNLLIQKGADINFKARNAICPIHVASKWGRTNMIKLLLDNGANIEAKTRDGLSPLHCAARSGHDQVVDLMLDRGAPVAPKTKNGLTPLHMACQGDHVDCARLLAYHKAPIDDVTVDYLTPLHVAAHCGNVRTAKLLLEKKCEVNARALNGFTPLHIACKKNRIKVVELLLQYMASIEATTESGLTPLHVAAFVGHMNIVLYLLQHGANPDFPTVRGETALHLAARANQTDIIRILLRNNANKDAKAREDQTTLHIAARLGNVDIVELLLQHGADVDATTKDQYTPLHIAAKEGQDEVAQVLLDHNASLTRTTKKGFTPLHIAAKYGNIKMVETLLDKGANPDVQGKNGLTPLHVATHYNHENVALLLLKNKASPHCTAKNGYTPLHIAAKKNQMDIAITLLEYDANPNAESKNGFTPLHLASQEGHTDMVSLLLERKADVNCKAKNGLTPMHLAAQEDRVPVAEILVKYHAVIDPQTKAGYTPLHTACHFGQINMIRFLLEHNASVNATTNLGYTPLHQAAQQGHTLVINLLLKYNADPNTITNTGQTPLSIAKKLGYISVVETLKDITEVQTTATDEKIQVVSPETMQEGPMTDSEDEGGEEMIGEPYRESVNMAPDMQYLMKKDDSISPGPTTKSQDPFSPAPYTPYTGVPATGMSLTTGHFLFPDDASMRSYDSRDFRGDSVSRADTLDRHYTEGFIPMAEEEVISPAAARTAYATMASAPSTDRDSRISAYSETSFDSTVLADNVAVDRTPLHSGFLVSFMVDARGGAMRGCRHSGVRIIVPPRKASMPTRVTCKLVKKEKLTHPPPLLEGEALASRVLEMGPVGAKFLGPVLIEVPHFASLRGREREITILRSDNGETWQEHTLEATEEAIQDAVKGSFEELETAEDLYHKRITRILTNDFPQYFAIVTRIRQEKNNVGNEGGMLNSTVVPQVQVQFPENALTKNINVGLQVQPIQPELVSKLLGNRVAVSPIVTIEPRRRKFHENMRITIPVPKASQKGMINQYGGDAPTLRLLCSVTGGTTPAQWEDITGNHPLTFVNDCVEFTTRVSARYWLMDCQNINEAAKMASDLYREAMAVPFMSKFVVFAKCISSEEARLRVFCMTDDKVDKTLEHQEHFIEVARSRDVEVLEGKSQWLEMAGNLVPVTKSGEQLHVNFHSFRENRLPFTVRVRDANQEAAARLAFMKEPKVARGEAPQTPICQLNVVLPLTGKDGPVTAEVDAKALKEKYDRLRGGVGADESISKGELRLTDIAEVLGDDWVELARQLGISEDEINHIKSQYSYVSEQALVMLHLWVQKNGRDATGNELERALKKIGREDVVRKCMYNIEAVTDEVEKSLAKVQLDDDGFDAFKKELGSSRGSSLNRGASLDVSYDEKDLIKESESADDSGSDAGSVVESKGVVKPTSLADDQIIPQLDPRHGVIKTPTADEEKENERKKAEAYAFLADSLDFGDVPVPVHAKQDSDGTPVDESGISKSTYDRPDEDLLTKVEALKELGMDDRMSVSSEESLVLNKDDKEDEKKKKDELAAKLAASEDQLKPEQAAPAHTEAVLFDPGYDTLDATTAAALDKSPEVTREFIEGEPQSKTEVQDFTETLPDGTVVKRKVQTTMTVQPVTEKVVQGGKEQVSVTEKPLKCDVVENVLEIPAGVDYVEGKFETDRAQVETKDILPNGVPLTKKVITTRVIEPKPNTEVEEVEVTLPDGRVVRRRIVRTRLQTTVITKIITMTPDGNVINEESQEEAIAPPPTPEEKVEIIEETPEIKRESKIVNEWADDNSAILKKRVTRVYIIKKFTKVITTVSSEGQVSVREVHEELPPEEHAPEVVILEVIQPTEIIESAPETKADVQIVNDTLEDGTIVKKKITKTFLLKKIIKKTRDIGPDGEITEDSVTEDLAPEEQPGAQVEILEQISPVEVLSETPDTKTETNEVNEVLDDGTIVRKKVTKVTVTTTLVKKLRTVGEDGEISENIITEELAPQEQEPKFEFLEQLQPVEILSEARNTKKESNEVYEVVDDGSIVKKLIKKVSVVTTITKKLRSIGDDGQISENVITEEMDPQEQEPEIEILEQLQPMEIVSDIPETKHDVAEVYEQQPDGNIVKKRITTPTTISRVTKKLRNIEEDGTLLVKTVTEDAEPVKGEPITEVLEELKVEEVVSEVPLQSQEVSEVNEVLDDGTILRQKVTKISTVTTVTKKHRSIGQDGQLEENIVSEETQPHESEPLVETLEELKPVEIVETLPDTKREVEEVEEVQEDGTVLVKKITRTFITKTVTKKLRTVGEDGQIVEDIVSEDLPSEEQPPEIEVIDEIKPTVIDVLEQEPDIAESTGIKIYTDTIEGEPETETDVQEFEETLPDGTIVKRKVIKTKQKQTITKRIVMEGPEGELPDDFSQETGGGPIEYMDTVEGEPDMSTNVQEYEETLPDGTVVKRRVVTTSEQQLVTERSMVEGKGPFPGLDFFEGPQSVPEPQPLSEDFIQPDDNAPGLQSLPPGPVNGVDNVCDDGAEPVHDGINGTDHQPFEEEAVAGEGPSSEGDTQTSRVLMKKRVHKKTIIRNGKEETIVTEESEVAQDDDGPDELRESMQTIIDQFMQGSGEIGQLPASEQMPPS